MFIQVFPLQNSDFILRFSSLFHYEITSEVRLFFLKMLIFCRYLWAAFCPDMNKSRLDIFRAQSFLGRGLAFIIALVCVTMMGDEKFSLLSVRRLKAVSCSHGKYLQWKETRFRLVIETQKLATAACHVTKSSPGRPVRAVCWCDMEPSLSWDQHGSEEVWSASIGSHSSLNLAWEDGH